MKKKQFKKFEIKKIDSKSIKGGIGGPARKLQDWMGTLSAYYLPGEPIDGSPSTGDWRDEGC